MEVITGERRNMRLRILSLIQLFTIVLTVYLNMGCYIGTQRDTCRYNLHASNKSTGCNFIGIGLQSVNNTADVNVARAREGVTNYLILECLDYYERLKECDKEENRYIPSIYGFNMKMFLTKKNNVIALR
ncbi:hypothetical protein [Leptospira interrogans]|uniref:hypothetical protein n=2 Tax=Leptospira interrogans TaxID=173 RepID=UPI001F4808AA|nr:hypothetical protein [Leptospira interrogans]